MLQTVDADADVSQEAVSLTVLHPVSGLLSCSSAAADVDLEEAAETVAEAAVEMIVVSGSSFCFSSAAVEILEDVAASPHLEYHKNSAGIT